MTLWRFERGLVWLLGRLPEYVASHSFEGFTYIDIYPPSPICLVYVVYSYHFKTLADSLWWCSRKNTPPVALKYSCQKILNLNLIKPLDVTSLQEIQGMEKYVKWWEYNKPYLNMGNSARQWPVTSTNKWHVKKGRSRSGSVTG